MKFYIHDVYFNAGKLLQYKRRTSFLLVVCYKSVNILFSNFASRHRRDLSDTRPIVSEVLRQLQVTGCADLAAVKDRVAMTTTENQIVWAKKDNGLLMSKTVLRQVWDKDRKRAMVGNKPLSAPVWKYW